MVKLKKKINELIKIRNDVTRSDLQGMVQAISMGLTKDVSLRNEIDDRILMIVDEAEGSTRKDLNYRIGNLEKALNNLSRLKKLKKVF